MLKNPTSSIITIIVIAVIITCIYLLNSKKTIEPVVETTTPTETVTPQVVSPETVVTPVAETVTPVTQ